MENPFKEIVERLDRIEDCLLNHKKEESSISSQPSDERLTRHEICKLYKISLPTVHQCMKRGLPYEKLGRKTLFRRSDVDEFFRKRKGGRTC